MKKKNKRALQIVHGYNEPFFSLANHYARAMKLAGWEIITVYLTGREQADIRQQTVADKRVFLEIPDKRMKGLKFPAIGQIRKIIREERPSFIIAQRYKPVYLSLMATLGSDVPVLGVSHAFGLLDSAGRRLFLRCFRHRLTLAGVSDAVTEGMRCSAPDLAAVSLHNCIDVDDLEPRLLSRRAAREKPGLDEEAFIFGNVGRLHRDKRQDTIIRAFASIAGRYPKAQLLLIGAGSCEQSYRNLIKQLGVEGRVLMPGAIADAATLFKAFDVYVSSSDREPFGIVLTEAMLAGLPVISTDCGGAPEVLGENALYFCRGDEAALQAHMEKMITTGVAERNAVGNAMYKRVRQLYSFPPFAVRLLEIVNRRVSI